MNTASRSKVFTYYYTSRLNSHCRRPIACFHNATTMKWMTSGSHRLKANLNQSFGARKNKKAHRSRDNGNASVVASTKLGEKRQSLKTGTSRRSSFQISITCSYSDSKLRSNLLAHESIQFPRLFPLVQAPRNMSFSTYTPECSCGGARKNAHRINFQFFYTFSMGLLVRIKSRTSFYFTLGSICTYGLIMNCQNYFRLLHSILHHVDCVCTRPTCLSSVFIIAPC